FELVGRDSNGAPVVKYGFTLKQWFVHRGSKEDTYSNTLSWCNSLGYQVPRVKDLTNASCRGVESGAWCQGSVGAPPSSPNNYYIRHIGSGFFSEWGRMYDYSGVGFIDFYYWTSDSYDNNRQFVVYANYGTVQYGTVDGGADIYYTDYSLCSHP
ncbi:hypothetical protein J3U16_12040, partial [Gilliamella sp. B3023]